MYSFLIVHRISLGYIRVGKEYHFKELKKRKLEDNHWREGPTKMEGPVKIEEID